MRFKKGDRVMVNRNVNHDLEGREYSYVGAKPGEEFIITEKYPKGVMGRRYICQSVAKEYVSVWIYEKDLDLIDKVLNNIQQNYAI